MTKYYECRYVRPEDPGDLLWGYHWRPAILVDDGTLPKFPNPSQCELIEQNMYDKETGQPVGDTRNFCISEYCTHEDCAPLTFIAEVDT